jgi:pimeloyl-ACP methyl ester carboxylesterase
MTTTATPIAPHDPDAAEAVTRTGPMFRVVIASLLTGVVGASVLTLLVFPGAAEHTITGTALLAFAAGWAMLAGLTKRFTNQPQRWARVPAVAMAATGHALIAFAPGNHGLTTAGWVWPPVLFVLTAWMAAQLRRTMTSRARWLVAPVICGLVLASIGGMVETVALHHDSDAIAMPGHLYDVNGHRLHMNCTGTGSPTVVLNNGTGEISQSWARITPAIAATTRVCAYDRAGQAWSDGAQHPQDSRAIATDLHALLNAAGEHGPYLIVGHSLGGIYGMAFAAQYPNDVAGLVLLDSSTPEQFTTLPDYPSDYTMIQRTYGILPSIARLGVGRLFSSGAFSSLPQPAAGQVRAFGTSSRGLENARDDSSTYRVSFREAQALRTLNGKPLVVLTATGSIADTAGWSAAQDKLATLSSNALHSLADTSHAGMLEDARGASHSINAIDAAVRSVRTQTPVSQ